MDKYDAKNIIFTAFIHHFNNFLCFLLCFLLSIFNYLLFSYLADTILTSAGLLLFCNIIQDFFCARYHSVIKVFHNFILNEYNFFHSLHYFPQNFFCPKLKMCIPPKLSYNKQYNNPYKGNNSSIPTVDTVKGVEMLSIHNTVWIHFYKTRSSHYNWEFSKLSIHCI